MVFLIVNDGKLCKTGSKVISFGDPIVIEYKRIKLISNKFDIFGKSQVMIVNYVKTMETKEKAVMSITYYDETAKPKRVSPLSFKKVLAIGPFDPSQYGNPVCYYTPAYQNENILINTQFWEIDKKDLVTTTTSLAQSCLSLGSATPYKSYFDIVNSIVGASGKVIVNMIKHKELCVEHILELNDSDSLIYEGIYVCLPEVDDLNGKEYILKNYYVHDNVLVKIKDNDDDIFEEYDKTYFLLLITKENKNDLTSFDYISSSMDLLTLFNDGNESFSKTYVDTVSSAYDMELVQKISSAVQKEDSRLVTALTKHVSPKKQELFSSIFPSLPFTAKKN